MGSAADSIPSARTLFYGVYTKIDPGSTPKIDPERLAVAREDFPGIVDSNPKRGWVELVGTEGNYLIDGPGNECIRRDGNTLTTTTSILADEGWRFNQNLADHLTGREKLVITAEWARRPIHILDLANRSARLGRSLKATYR